MGHKNKNSRLQPVRLTNSALLLLLAANAEATANTIDCTNLPTWDSASTYNTGDQIQQDNKGYEAKWWTQSNPKLKSGKWDEWSVLGSCTSQAENLLPVISITQPINGFQLPENDNAVLMAQANDEDGVIKQVSFYENGILVNTDTEAPYSFNWSPSALGRYQITAEATDNLDGKALSEVVIVDVVKPNTTNVEPTATIASSNLGNIYVGDPVELVLNGTDSDGLVTSLELLENDSSVVTTSETNFVYNWTPLKAGSYNFKVLVTDNDLGTGLSETLTLNVLAKDVVGNERDKCRPSGLYQTESVNTPYCSIYDEQGREDLGPDHSRRIIGYFTSWRNGANEQPTYLVSDIPWQKLTHINYAFAHVNGQNEISIGDPTDPNNPATSMTWPNVAGAEMDPQYSYKGHFNLLNKYKKANPHVKTLISVGGWAETGGYFAAAGRVNSGGFYTMTTNSDGSVNYAGINAFANSVVEFLREYRFDGVDIDYEYPSSMADSGHPDDFDISNPLRGSLNASYQVLMKTLRETLDKAGEQDNVHYMLTIAAPSSGYLLRGMETFQTTQYLDYVNIMSYDLHGAWNSHVGPNAPLFDTGEDSELATWDVYKTAEYEGIGYLNTDWAVRYFRGAMSAGRINIGVPYYTRGFKHVVGGTNGLWGQAKLPEQANCPKGTGVGDKNFCGNGAVGIDNLWHDVENDREVPAGSNPLWHTKNLEKGTLGSYAASYGLDPVNDPEDKLTGQYQRFFDATAVSPWLWNDQKKVFLSTEDEESMAIKVDYVIEQGLGGIMFWELAGDFSYDSVKQEYFMGSTMTSIAYDKFKQSGQPYDIHIGNKNHQVPAEQVDVAFVAKGFPNGDENYPIAPTFSFTNHSDLDLSGSKISFDVPVSTSAIFKSNWNAQKKLKLSVEQNASNASGNNIGGFENEFHRFSIELVNEWGGEKESFKPGETIDVQVMYYMPITGPSNFTISTGSKDYAVKFEHPTLPAASNDGSTGSGCGTIDLTSIPSYPDFPQKDWNGNPSHANTGDQLIHNNALWQANWWTNKVPAEGDWTLICQL